MPNFNKYKCNKCRFVLGKGFGYSFYVENDKGERIHCAHPGERGEVHKVLGYKASSLAVIRERTGFNSHCVCLDCLHQFSADLGKFKRYHPEVGTFKNYYWSPYEREREEAMFLRPEHGKDKRECPECKSKNIKLILQMAGEPCPKCKKGIIEEIRIGVS